VRKGDVKEIVRACMTPLEENITVYLSESQIKSHSQILESQSLDLTFNPSLKKIYLDKKSLTPDSYTSLIEGITKSFDGHFDYNAMKTATDHMLNPSCDGITLVANDKSIIDVHCSDTSIHLYGGAVDIGTTSVVLYIYDMTDGSLLGVYSGLNQQRESGADVINRIMYCSQKPSGIDELQENILNTINSLIDKACIDTPHLKEHLYQLVMCGNSTMQHLFLGFDPVKLGQSPFISVYRDTLVTNASLFNLNVPKKCQIIFLPLLGGFVGADTTAVLLSVEANQKRRLIIDLGTNGEIAVSNGDQYMVASTACGPALEGAGIEYGMRGSTGAIERFEILQDGIHYKVIGDSNPKGICGSGIVDIIAELLKIGVLDNTGKMLSPEKFAIANPNSSLTKNLVTHGGKIAFMVVSPDDSFDGEGVYVTQKDIRQVQLAKSAIFTGCQMLLDKYGLKGEELDEILLAGAFGNYINVNNAQHIGLIPAFDGVTIFSIGNAAGTGVQQYLLNQLSSDRCKEIVQKTKHIELASDPDFQNLYVQNMYFKGVRGERGV
ncbi:MAG: DUF4445 domain-containing protein, partial [Dethiosulfatibacter sp.]|nr:DUF4445 domain-containing protein [Dethiosulfatibacter sp.]